MTMNREDWLKWRKIGSSDAPVIEKVSPYTTPFQLWLQKTQGIEREDNPGMRYGRETEEEARKCLEKMLGLFLVPTNVQSPEYEWMTASLDGYDESREVIGEIKCCGEKDHALAKRGLVPPKYYPQCQHQMIAKEKYKMVYLSYYKWWTGEEWKADPVILYVNRENDYEKQMIKNQREFWHCLLTQTPPPKLLKDEPYEEGTPEVMEKYIALKEARHNRKEWEKKEAELHNELIHMASGKNLKFDDGKLYQSIVKGSVQYDQIPQLHGIDLNQYRKSPSLRWTVI